MYVCPDGLSVAGLCVLDDSREHLAAGLGGRTCVERRLRVVLDHELSGLGGGSVDDLAAALAPLAD